MRDVKPIEWPTILLVGVIYLGWLGLTGFWGRLPPWLILPIGGWLGAWFMSLQHEIMHGHPTRHQRLNDVLGLAPLMLWMPYHRYKDTHLRHHRQEWLTDPLQDPESAYHGPERWARMSAPARWLHLAGVTLLGRVIVGPFLAIYSFWKSEVAMMVAGDRRIARIWAGHMLGAALVACWLILVCHVSLVSYGLLVVWPGTGLSLLRSLVEHRAAARPQDRTAIVEHGGPLALLYLNNNLHVVHHLYPGLPWYRLPGAWLERKTALLQYHRGPYYRSYLTVAAQFMVTPHNRGFDSTSSGTPRRHGRS